MVKFKKIATVCNKSKAIIILHQLRDDELVAQWIGDGVAFYPVTGLPLLTEENIFTLFDLSPKQQDEYNFQQTTILDTYCFDDNSLGEQPVKEHFLSFFHNSAEIIPLHNQENILFVKERYLAPVYASDGYSALFERKSKDGTPYIVAKNGLLISAVILPYRIREEAFIREFEQTAQVMASEFRKSREQNEPEEQAVFW